MDKSEKGFVYTQRKRIQISKKLLLRYGILKGVALKRGVGQSPAPKSFMRIYKAFTA